MPDVTKGGQIRTGKGGHGLRAATPSPCVDAGTFFGVDARSFAVTMADVYSISPSINVEANNSRTHCKKTKWCFWFVKLPLKQLKTSINLMLVNRYRFVCCGGIGKTRTR